MPSSPVIEGNNLISYSITSDGTAIPESYGVMSISISQEINTIASAQITIRDGNAADQMFQITDNKTFEPGSQIEISLGYNQDNQVVFSGIVIKQSIQIGESGTTLQISCKDSIIKATESKSNLILKNSLHSEAIEKLASDLGIDADVTATTVKEKIIQYNATDWDFIVNKAELNSMVVTTEIGKLVVSPPALDDTPELELMYGRDILEMDTELDASNQYQSITVNYMDIDSKSLMTVEPEDISGNDEGDLSDSKLNTVLSATRKITASGPISAESAQVLANATLLKYKLSKYKGSIKFMGSASVKPNTLISLKGLGDRFDGNAYISSVSHSVSDGKWETEIQLGTSDEWFSEKISSSMEPTASGNLKGIKGLHTGTVTQIFVPPGGDDPDDTNAQKEFMVQLEIPVINKTETIWARLSTFYASNNFGAFFYPEIGDEVVVGFINGSPEFPIILGSLYSSTLPPPTTIESDDNFTKMLMTKSQLQMQFDDENAVITIQTPGNNIVTISDKDKGITITDQNSNAIQMNDSGVTINSASSITINATKDLTIQGDSITIKANKSISIDGGKGCDISGGSSPVNVTGSKINLN